MSILGINMSNQLTCRGSVNVKRQKTVLSRFGPEKVFSVLFCHYMASGSNTTARHFWLLVLLTFFFNITSTTIHVSITWYSLKFLQASKPLWGAMTTMAMQQTKVMRTGATSTTIHATTTCAEKAAQSTSTACRRRYSSRFSHTSPRAQSHRQCCLFASIGE